MLENVYSFGGFNECRTSLQRRIAICMKIHPAPNCVNVARKDSAQDRRELLMRWRAASAAYRIGYATLNPKNDYKSPRVNTCLKWSHLSRGALNAGFKSFVSYPFDYLGGLPFPEVDRMYYAGEISESSYAAYCKAWRNRFAKQ